jgi:hypothetical protein
VLQTRKQHAPLWDAVRLKRCASGPCGCSKRHDLAQHLRLHPVAHWHLCQHSTAVYNDLTQVRLVTAKLLKPDPPPKTPRTVGRPLTEWQVTYANAQQRLSCSASLDGLDSFFSNSIAMMSLDQPAADDWYRDGSNGMARPHSLSNLKESRGGSRHAASRGTCCSYMCPIVYIGYVCVLR